MVIHFHFFHVHFRANEEQAETWHIETYLFQVFEEAEVGNNVGSYNMWRALCAINKGVS